MQCIIVFDLDSDSVVFFWYPYINGKGMNTANLVASLKAIYHEEQYDVYLEYQGTSCNIDNVYGRN